LLLRTVQVVTRNANRKSKLLFSVTKERFVLLNPVTCPQTKGDVTIKAVSVQKL
jgi:hypothetical protein